jgi:hypothetical protein
MRKYVCACGGVSCMIGLSFVLYKGSTFPLCYSTEVALFCIALYAIQR